MLIFVFLSRLTYLLLLINDSMAICPPGTFSASGNCVGCGKGTFSSISDASACTACNSNPSCPVGSVIQYCTSTSDFTCTACPAVLYCTYTISNLGACTTANGPACQCVAGYEKINGQCQPCKVGYFQSGLGDVCSKLSTPTCGPSQYLVIGTRYVDSTCLSCAGIALPSSNVIYAGTTECTWKCNVGFSTNMP